MSTLDTLLHRNSHPRLTDPGPDADQLQTILQAALRAPDHGRLRPWRFVVITGDRRAVLGECFQRSLVLKGITDAAQLTKAENAPLRAPLVLAGLLHAVAHEKVLEMSRRMRWRLRSTQRSWRRTPSALAVSGAQEAMLRILMSSKRLGGNLVIRSLAFSISVPAMARVN
jgi:nitroreductase